MERIISNHPEWETTAATAAELDNALILETRLPSVAERNNYIFINPVSEIIVRCGDDVESAFERIESAVRDGLHAAGFLSYELGYCLEDGVFSQPEESALPLLHIGLYDSPIIFDTTSGRWLNPPPKELTTNSGHAFSRAAVSSLFLTENRETYTAKIGEIHRCIEAGDTYQINHTFRARFRLHGTPQSLYFTLRERQRVPYSAFWRRGGQFILSFSPELFFRIDDGEITVRPMKGTAPRGKNTAEDAELENFLGTDEKNRAENLMIVDLLRNDLGRIAWPGSVDTTQLFDIESYETLFQMTSTVRARLAEDTRLRDIFASLFPCGSVTGAPKISSMKIIRALESDPRGVYCGAVGFIAPRMSAAAFSVAIRTVQIDGDACELGIGGGIVYDSEPESEWREALIKGGFFFSAATETPPAGFSLIETILWTPADGFFLLDLHIDRIRASSAHFGFAFDESRIREALDSATPDGAGGSLRVRLLLDASGCATATAAPVDPPDPSITHRCVISKKAVFSSDPLLRHKTTFRNIYDSEFDAYRKLGYFDVLFTNERGELTEGAITNIVLRYGDTLCTPPVDSGLLPGVFRRHLIDARDTVEKTLFPSDLETADEIFLCNSVRGLVKVDFVDTRNRT